MKRVFFYSGLLLVGMLCSQSHLSFFHSEVVHLVTMICLSYIMIDVGLEFVIDKTRVSSYAFDYGVAASAAACPWILCSLYFLGVLHTPWKASLLVAQFAAPTSAGVLFTMLASAGLKETWVFQKARLLAIFDDLHTVLLMVPLQMLFIGLEWRLAIVIMIIGALLATAYFFFDRLLWPTKKKWILGYAVAITFACIAFRHYTSIRIEVLLPAFTLGCLLKNKESVAIFNRSYLDEGIKIVFLFLVGCSLPRVSLESLGYGILIVHVLAITVLSNLGKCFPLACYRDKITFRERLALSIAMFPRGEVGAGVLLIAMSYGLTGSSLVVGSLSLALNLLCTGLFIVAVKQLLSSR